MHIHTYTFIHVHTHIHTHTQYHGLLKYHTVCTYTAYNIPFPIQAKETTYRSQLTY